LTGVDTGRKIDTGNDDGFEGGPLVVVVVDTFTVLDGGSLGKAFFKIGN